MKTKILGLLMVVVLLVSACSQSVSDQLAKGQDLLRNREYDAAIEIFEQIVEGDATQFDAWQSLVKAMIRDEQYAHAEEALEKYFKAIEGTYAENTDVENRDLIRSVVNFANDIQSEGERIGSWYDDLEVPYLDFYDISGTYDIGEAITLEAPEGITLYYTLDGSDPNPKDVTQKYTAPFVIEEEGEFTLYVVGVNKYGMESQSSYAWISSYDLPEALVPSMPGGSYDGPIQIYFEGFDYDTMDLMYSIDGSDPVSYGYYYDAYSGIELSSGEYTLRASYYDYNTSQYSAETVEEYSVTNPYALSDYTEITVAIYDVHDWVGAEIEYAIDDINSSSSDGWVSYYYVYDFENLKQDLASGYAQMAYCPSRYVEFLAEDALIVPIDKAFSPVASDYYKDALEAGSYENEHYTLPVTIGPNMLLYYNTEDVGSDYYADIDTWQELVGVANEGSFNNNFIYTMDDAGEAVFSFYNGLGGTLDSSGTGGYNLDRETLVAAMELAQNLPTIYGLGYNGMDSLAYMDALELGNATMVYSTIDMIEAYNGSWYYTPSGPMPLPNGGYASSVNLVEGLHISPNVVGDADMVKLSQLVYKTLSEGSNVNYIAGYGEAIPAKISAANPEELYLYGYFDDYERAVMNNVTLPMNEKFDAMIRSISIGLYRVVYEGADMAGVVETIIESAK